LPSLPKDATVRAQAEHDFSQAPERTHYRFSISFYCAGLKLSQAAALQNGMAEAFFKTFKRDYVRVNPLPDAKTVLWKIT